MRTKILIASLGLGVAGALLPATAASAQCLHIEGVGCVSPQCKVAAAVNTALALAGQDDQVACTL